MKQSTPISFRERFVQPRPLLMGVLLSFAVCCLGGRLAREGNPFKWTTRFHRYISPETNLFPTASQVRSLARSRLHPDRVAVIVGGNSILHGTGQRERQLWTHRLQELLGDEYCVLNLALPGALPGEFGGVIAEALDGEYSRMIYITDLGSSTGPGDSDGQLYRYFFWDAYYKDMLPRDPERDQRLDELAKERMKIDEKNLELLRGRRLDSVLSYQDLWTDRALRRFSTTWSPGLALGWMTPRLRYPDTGGVPSTEYPYPPVIFQESMEIVRSVGPSLGGGAFGRAVPRTEQGSGVHPRPEESLLVRGIMNCFPPTARRRTLFLLMRDSPYYVERMGREEQEEYRWGFQAANEVLEAAGLFAVEAGGDFDEDDFIDRCHLSEQGGRKLADRVAPKIRQMAHKLNYIPDREAR